MAQLTLQRFAALQKIYHTNSEDKPEVFQAISGLVSDEYYNNMVSYLKRTLSIPCKSSVIQSFINHCITHIEESQVGYELLTYQELGLPDLTVGSHISNELKKQLKQESFVVAGKQLQLEIVKEYLVKAEVVDDKV